MSNSQTNGAGNTDHRRRALSYQSIQLGLLDLAHMANYCDRGRIGKTSLRDTLHGRARESVGDVFRRTTWRSSAASASRSAVTLMAYYYQPRRRSIFGGILLIL